MLLLAVSAMRMLSFILAFTLLVVVFAIASLFSFTSFMRPEMQGAKRISFIVLLWLYGAYRAYRLYVLSKSIKNKDA
jgi:hypothetical protein